MDTIQNEYEFLFLTLTVRNCSAEDYKKTLDMMYSGWRWLYHKSPVFRNVVKGSFRSLETTINKQNYTYHPHFHIILAVKKSYFKKGYLSHKQWVALWREACQLDYDPVVDVRKITPRKTDDEEITLAGAVSEVAKYSVKDSDYLNCDRKSRMQRIETLLSGLTGRRLVSWTGCFSKARKALNLDDAETGDLINVSGDELRNDIKIAIVRYGWRNGAYEQF